MFTKETWYNQKELYHVFSFSEKARGTKEEIHETEIEISYFVLYYYVCTNFLVASFYCGILPSTMGDDNTQYGSDARRKRLGI